jgi:hypothetical protein
LNPTDDKALDAQEQQHAVPASPVVSFVMIVYNMPEQASNTIRSLMVDYQIGVCEHDYELIVVENDSANRIPPAFIESLPANISYHLIENPHHSPAVAINYGAGKARGRNVCIMIDGARMLTPGVVKNIILGHRITADAVVTVPGYHLGRELQQEAVGSGYGVEQERALLESVDWPARGYRLFDIACFSGSCIPGFFLPNSESNCISIPRHIWDQLGGCDCAFDLRGGGLINLDLYRRAVEFSGVQHIILPGEGTFHQFHGGVTTGGEEDGVREAYIEHSKAQYRQLRGVEHSNPETTPIYLGELPEQVQKFIYYSAKKNMDFRGESPLDDA